MSGSSLFEKVLVTLGLVMLFMLIAAQVWADTINVNFNAYALGTVHGQDGWSSSGPYDVAVVDNTYSYIAFGARSLRISNAVTSSSFGDHTFSKPLTEEAGETAAYVDVPTAVRHSYFSAQWDFASTVPGAEQPGLSVVASPDRGDGGRMSWVQMADTPTGLEVNFYDYQDAPPYGSAGTITDGYGPEDDFIFTNLVSGLDRTVPHTIKIEMFLVDGPHNDVVKVYIDGVLEHTGTSWEDYFRWTQGPGGPEQTAPVHESRVIRSVLFRVGGTAAPGTLGNGFLIDNFTAHSGPEPCTTDCYVDATTGDDSNGGTSPADAMKTIQAAVNQVSVGGNVHVAAGTYVEQVNVAKDLNLQGAGVSTVVKSPTTLTGYFTTSANNYPIIWVHDAGDVTVQDLLVDGDGKGNTNYRFVGVGYDNAGGLVEDVEIKGIRNTPIDGSQHGIGIFGYAQEATARSLTVNRCTIYDFQKNGMTFSGADLTATITENDVTGAGAVNFIAQNGIQLSFGATGAITNNEVSGVSYTPSTWVSTGILLYQPAGDISTEDNTVNEAQVGIYYIENGGSIARNTVTATLAGTGTSYIWGVVVDPGGVPSKKPQPYDAVETLQRQPAEPVTQLVINTTVDQNTISGDGATGTGLEIDALGTDVLNVMVTANTVNAWDYGIVLYKDPGASLNATITECNQIFDNASYGAYNLTDVVVDAAGNWWGDPTGPSGEGPGSGDAISSNLTFTPWGTDGSCNILSSHNLTFLANELVKVNRNIASDGDIHCNGKIEFGKGNPGVHTGDLTALDDITIGSQNTIDGDVTAGDELYRKAGVTITGNATDHALIAAIPLPSLSFSAGSQNVNVPVNGSHVLAPGSYGKVKVNKNATLYLSPGEYLMNILDTELSAVLSIDASSAVSINVVTDLDFATKVQVVLTGLDASTYNVAFNTLQDPKVDIGQSCLIQGFIVAQNAEVHFSQGCKFKGSIVADAITLDKKVSFRYHGSIAPFPKDSDLEPDEEEVAEEAAEVVTDYELSQNYPNPFNPTTMISLALPEAGNVAVQIFNESGQLVRTVLDREMAAGRHEVRWNGRNEAGNKVAAGIYLYRIIAHGPNGEMRFVENRRMTLLK